MQWGGAQIIVAAEVGALFDVPAIRDMLTGAKTPMAIATTIQPNGTVSMVPTMGGTGTDHIMTTTQGTATGNLVLSAAKSDVVLDTASRLIEAGGATTAQHLRNKVFYAQKSRPRSEEGHLLAGKHDILRGPDIQMKELTAEIRRLLRNRLRGEDSKVTTLCESATPCSYHLSASIQQSR